MTTPDPRQIGCGGWTPPSQPAKEKADDRLARMACSPSSVAAIMMTCGKCSGPWVSPQNAQILMDERDEARALCRKFGVRLRAITHDLEITGTAEMVEAEMDAHPEIFPENR